MDTFTKYGSCRKMAIWIIPSLTTVHVVYGCPLKTLTISPGLRLTFCISLPLIFKLGLTILTPSLVGCLLLVWLEQFRVSISGLQKMNAFFMLKMSQIKNGTALQTYNFLFLGTRKKCYSMH